MPRLARLTATVPRLTLLMALAAAQAISATPARSGRLDAPAAQLAGVDMPDSVTLDGKTLVLNGLGLRTKFLFKLYVAGLYLEAKSTDAAAIIAADQPKKMVLRIVYSEISREQLVEAWTSAFNANSASSMAALRERIDRFNSMMETVRSGDRIEVGYVPGRGTNVWVKGLDKGWITGEDFMQAVFAIWLGPFPVQSSMKDGLVGKP